MTTKAEFIADYVRESGLPESCIRDDGFEVDGRLYTVKPCSCEYPNCRGWVMSHEGRIVVLYGLRHYGAEATASKPQGSGECGQQLKT